MLKALIADVRKCTGCDSCVLACSFEKKGEFSPRALIAVRREIHEGVFFPMAVVNYSGEAGTNVERCDMCGGKPACVQACGFGVIRLVDWEKYSDQTDEAADKQLVSLVALGEV
ncbi:MAG: hypothetical protein M5U22_10645 [Thermoleophilia bacterium]|nr:hypothetical protein [Thermoleophilia bacterium]